LLINVFTEKKANLIKAAILKLFKPD